MSPIGNLRVQEAVRHHLAEGSPNFSREDICRYHWELCAPLFSSERLFGAGLGAGGDAPKLLLAEDSSGRLYLDGTEPAGQAAKRWLVKFPRGNATLDDRAVLKAEYVFTSVLGEFGLDVMAGVEWLEGDLPSLWIPRFDLTPEGDRSGIESVYSLMGVIGDGARLLHTQILERLLPLAASPDDTLVDYLVRDLVNRLIGNSDNHGRNQSVIRDDSGIRLAPCYDVAPMVLDPEGIPWATVWPTSLMNDDGWANYRRIIEAYAQEPSAAIREFLAWCEKLSELGERAKQRRLPSRVLSHPRVPLRLPRGLLTY
ncbi:HipA domain-containing protein [Mangrovitalea sediminis]|uniref:HipA domain-containing protein n=1 Tax=Mangrovitalea sediminis TaxID=1982043 RepID=UPI0013041533|nr:HipA domain-containing protein [Mangrovitalea sediminis]